MAQGIAVFGLNGSGKSTIAHALAKRTGRFVIDSEDYYFPEQSASRVHALECGERIETEHLGEMPFSVSRTKDEAQAAMLADMRAHPRFVLVSVSANWPDEILGRIGIAFVLQAPAQERVRRIQAREELRFGERVLPGGDMYEQQSEFRKIAFERDPAQVKQSMERLRCPAFVLDGLRSMEENLLEMLAQTEGLLPD